MIVRDVMVKKVQTLDEDASFEDIIKLLLRKRVSGLPIVNKKQKIVGVISEKDLLHSLFPSEENFYKDMAYYKNFQKIELEAHKICHLTAKDVMTKEVITVHPDNHILVACSLIAIHGIRRLPVVEDDKLVGIVTTNNLYKNYLSSFFGK